MASSKKKTPKKSSGRGTKKSSRKSEKKKTVKRKTAAKKNAENKGQESEPSKLKIEKESLCDSKEPEIRNRVISFISYAGMLAVPLAPLFILINIILVFFSKSRFVRFNAMKAILIPSILLFLLVIPSVLIALAVTSIPQLGATGSLLLNAISAILFISAVIAYVLLMLISAIFSALGKKFSLPYISRFVEGLCG